MLSNESVTRYVRGKSAIEIDFLIEQEAGCAILVELKVRTRKPTLCKALGQAVLNKHTFKGKAFSIICVPDDVTWFEGFDLQCMRVGIRVCHARELAGEVAIIRHFNALGPSA